MANAIPGGSPSAGQTWGRLICSLLTPCALLWLSACSTTVAYNPAYVAAARRPAAQALPGRALVLTQADDDAYTFTGHPTSFTGSANTMTIPLGAIMRDTARIVYGDHFEQGVEMAPRIPDDTSGYTVIIHPIVAQFSYQFNQLKNAGFAITPIVTLSIQVQLLDEKGATKWNKAYASGSVEGSRYFIDIQPSERINQLTHQVVYDLLVKSVPDIAAGISAGRASEGETAK